MQLLWPSQSIRSISVSFGRWGLELLGDKSSGYSVGVLQREILLYENFLLLLGFK